MSIKAEVEAANQIAVERMIESEPWLVGVTTARDAIPILRRNHVLLHAGPPVTWEAASGPLRGALIGAALYEEWARTPEEAARWIPDHVELHPNHEHSAVGPMAGVLSPTMPVFAAKNETYGNIAYTNFNEGLGRVLRYGAYSEDVLTRLAWMRDTLAPALAAALTAVVREKRGINLRNLIAQALHMGDECHNRNVAATSLFLRELAPYLLDVAERSTAREILRFIDGNNHFFVNLAMLAGKVMGDAAHSVRYSTLVTAMARNGTDFGIRVSGVGESWLTAPALVPRGLYFPGFKETDANPDIGDSTITETVGLGGAAMAASPPIVRFVGGTVEDAISMTRRMTQITLAKHRYFTIPYLNFEGTPTGIDIRKVVRTGITPQANTGIAHKEPGIGQIGAGIVDIPAEPFKQALLAFAREYGI